MLTSFFEKSNPINYVLIAVFICVGYVLGGLKAFPEMLTLAALPGHFFFLLLVVFSMFLLDFLIRKNQLTKNNTFAIYCFGCFIVMLPVLFTARELIAANILLMLGLRRVLSLTSEKNVEKKILDAALWIGIATFLYFWSFLFYAVLFVQVLQQKNTNYKHLIIPFLGMLAVASLATAYWLLAFDSFPQWNTWKEATGMDFSAYNHLRVLLPTSILATLLLWTVTNRLLKRAKAGKKRKPNQLVLLLTLATTLAIALAAPTKTGAELFFIFPALAILVANYFERVKEFWFRELLLWLLLLSALAMLVL